MDGGTSPSLDVIRLGDEDKKVKGEKVNGHAEPSSKDVDDLLPIGVSNVSVSQLSSYCKITGSTHSTFVALAGPTAASKGVQGDYEEGVGSCRGCQAGAGQREYILLKCLNANLEIV